MENWRKKGRKEDSKQQMSSARLELGHIGSVGVSKPYAHQNIESAPRPIIYAGGWRVQPRSAAHPFSTYSGLAIFTSVWPTSDSRRQNVVTRRSCGSQLNSCAGGEKNSLKKFLLLLPRLFCSHPIRLAPASVSAARQPFHGASCDALWIIHSDMIDRRIELRDRLISGLVKRNPNDHWNLKCDLNDRGGGAGGRVLDRRGTHRATAWLWITISLILIVSSRCVCCWRKAMGDMKMEDRKKNQSLYRGGFELQLQLAIILFGWKMKCSI